MDIAAVSARSSPGWRWRILNHSAPMVQSAIAHGIERMRARDGRDYEDCGSVPSWRLE